MSGGDGFGSRRIALLVALTLTWGLNWPIMKLGISDYPPLTFRAISMCLGLPLLGLAVVMSGHRFSVPRGEWRELGKLTATNMLVWHMLAIVCLRALSSGRAAILGYTMPIFAALLGGWLYGQTLTSRHVLGVLAASCGVALLLWHEFARMAGVPWAAAGMLLAAAAWALGTLQLRRTSMRTPTLVIIFWMLALTTVSISAMAWAIERQAWAPPNPTAWAAIAFNALMIFAFAQPVWLYLARNLPPMASSLSVMMIPVLGVVSGALWLGEQLHWQDHAAIVLMLVAIASVLWPVRASGPAQPA